MSTRALVGTVPTPRIAQREPRNQNPGPVPEPPPNPWTITVGPRAGTGSRIGPEAFAIKFTPPIAKRGRGRIEFIIGADVSLRTGFQADGIDSAILRISTDLKRGRLEPTTRKTSGSIRLWGARTIRVRCSGDGFPLAVVEGIALAALPEPGTTIPTLIEPHFQTVTNRGIGAIEFSLPPARAQRSSPTPSAAPTGPSP